MASFLSELAGKKDLKKTATRDGSKPVTTNLYTEEEVTNFQLTQQAMNCEAWESLLKEETFKTHLLPLSVDEARAFLNITTLYNAKSKGVKDISSSASDDEIIKNVSIKLQKLIDSELGWKERGVFVKTSCRSAKDAAIAHDQLLDSYRNHLALTSSHPYPINERLISLLHAATQMLRCRDANHAIQMLSQSERIENDMRMALEVFEKKGIWNEHLVIREWQDIDISMEWRCFIKDRKVTAISQYNCVPYFPKLHTNSSYIQGLLLNYLNDTVLPLLPSEDFKDMVIDVAITGDNWLVKPKMWVIELNPFLWSTSGSLYSWTTDADVLHGKKPFEFRLQQVVATEKEVRGSISTQWRSIVEMEI